MFYLDWSLRSSLSSVLPLLLARLWQQTSNSLVRRQIESRFLPSWIVRERRTAFHLLFLRNLDAVALVISCHRKLLGEYRPPICYTAFFALRISDSTYIDGSKFSSLEELFCWPKGRCNVRIIPGVFLEGHHSNELVKGLPCSCAGEKNEIGLPLRFVDWIRTKNSRVVT